VAVDAKAIDQAVAYLLMFAALFVTYLAHWYMIAASVVQHHEWPEADEPLVVAVVLL
jgi:hypothetical protein